MNNTSASAIDCVTIKVRGDFSFALNAAFKEALQRYPKGEQCFIVDVGDVHELDSSALGMLLQLREHSRGGNSVQLLNPWPAITARLNESGMLSLFTIVEG
jgi:anti-anti-sigma factor